MVTEESVELIKKFLLWTIVVVVALAVAGAAAAYFGVFSPNFVDDYIAPTLKTTPSEDKQKAIDEFRAQNTAQGSVVEPKQGESAAEAQYRADLEKQKALQEAKKSVEPQTSETPEQKQAAIDAFRKSQQ